MENGDQTAAFEAAFTQAQADAETYKMSTSTGSEEHSANDVWPPQMGEHGRANVSPGLSPAESGSSDDIPPETPTVENNHTTSSGDDLSRTAGRLVQAVADNESPKFRESNFMSLMRQLRDKEVVVDGNDMKNVSRPVIDLCSD